GFRDERGQFALPDIVRTVWNDLLKPGLAQIHVQRNKATWEVPLPEDAERCVAPHQPVVYHPHPLSTEAYNDLIRGADVGLLLHDAHSYYARLSAVFQEDRKSTRLNSSHRTISYAVFCLKKKKKKQRKIRI